MINCDEIKMALEKKYSCALEKLLNERHATVRNCLLTVPNRAGVAVWYIDGEFIVEPVWKYGLSYLPDRPGQPLVIFGVGEYLKLNQTEIIERILSALETRILKNIEKT
jgi:hypothetical protein